MSGTYRCQWVRYCGRQCGDHVCQHQVWCGASFQDAGELMVHVMDHTAENFTPMDMGQIMSATPMNMGQNVFATPMNMDQNVSAIPMNMDQNVSAIPMNMEQNVSATPSGFARPADRSSNPVAASIANGSSNPIGASDDADRSSNPVGASDANRPSNPFPAPYTLRNPPVIQADGLVGIPASNLPIFPAYYRPNCLRSGRSVVAQRQIMGLELPSRMRLRSGMKLGSRMDSERPRQSRLRNVLTDTPPAPDAEMADAIPDADAADDEDTICMPRADTTAPSARDAREASDASDFDADVDADADADFDSDFDAYIDEDMYQDANNTPDFDTAIAEAAQTAADIRAESSLFY